MKINLNPFSWKIFNSTLADPDEDLIDSLLSGNTSSTGVNVTEQRAMQVGAVNACVRVLSNTFASLPLHLKKAEDDKLINAKDHPLYELLHILPNSEITSYNHRQMIMSKLLLKGTSYNETSKDGRGQVREIYPLCGQMKVVRSKSNKLIYDYYDGSTNRIIPNSNMWRITGNSDNGIIGKTPLTIARETIGQAIAANDFGGSIFKNSGRLQAVLKVAQKLNKESRDDILKAWNDSYSGSSNAGKTGLLHNGAELQTVSMNLVDAQFLETMKFNRTEIAGFFGVPPHMIGDLERATFSNIEHQSISFVIYSLLPHLINFEQSIYRDLLTPTERKIYKPKFSVDGLLRGDSKSRADFYKALFNMGAITRNEIRSYEDINPIDGGDSAYMQINMGKIDENGNIGQANESTQQINEPNPSESEG